jgi:hypothetical protein
MDTVERLLGAPFVDAGRIARRAPLPLAGRVGVRLFVAAQPRRDVPPLAVSDADDSRATLPDRTTASERLD